MMKFSLKYIFIASVASILALSFGFVIFNSQVFRSRTVEISNPAGESGTGRESISVIDEEFGGDGQEETKDDDGIADRGNNPAAADADDSKETKKNKTEDNDKQDDDEAEKPSNLNIKNEYVSWGFAKSSGRGIDTVIIHSSYNALGGDPYDLDLLLSEYKQYSVAPHYLIDREGNIYRLVDEKNIAYHAGVSQTPDGRNDVNNFSIGIELMNKEESEFTDGQYGALNKLLGNIKSRYAIKYVLGHNQIAPGRKTDPWNFDWDKIN